MTELYYAVVVVRGLCVTTFNPKSDMNNHVEFIRGFKIVEGSQADIKKTPRMR
jgi:hypothetical protein